MHLEQEIKRKLFHHLALIYLGMYWMLPRIVTLVVLGVVVLIFWAVEFLRLRRPELNAWFLKKFEAIIREAEVMKISGVFWTLLGCWLTMLVFTNKNIVLPALGMLIFGDAAAALGGKKWGKRRWPMNPLKTFEGSACFAAVSVLWTLIFLKWPVALLGAVTMAWVEVRPLPWNDNFWIPLISGAVLSVFNLVLGR